MSNEGTPLHGDRAAWNDVDHPTEHARDISEGVHTRHLPAPLADGTYVRDDGNKWVRQLELPLEDFANYARGAIIRGGTTDWEALAPGSADTVLKSDGTDVAWGSVDHSELTGVNADDHHDPVTLDSDANAMLSLTAQELGLDAQAANTVLAGPASGADAAPAFRLLASDDLPAHTHVEADITDLEHDAVKLRGRAIDPTAPTDGQMLIWDDAASQWEPQDYQAGDPDAIHDDVSGEIHALTEKTTPEDNDELIIEDSSASYVKKRIKIGNIAAGGGGDPVFRVLGALATATCVGGAYVFPREATIGDVYIYCGDPGDSGSTIVDVNVNDTTIFSTQANRPELAYDDTDGVAKSTPDIVDLTENDILTVDIDQVASGAEDLTVVIAIASSGGGGSSGGGADILEVQVFS